jgi:hypothetical protein
MNVPLEIRYVRLWALILIIGGLIVQSSVIFVKREALAHRPFEEDTFFHMTVTRNMAMGKGITIDGVKPTSGAQPGNFIYVLAHLAARFDKWQALRWARLLDFLASIGAAGCLYLIVCRLLYKESHEKAAAYALLTAGIWLSSFQVFRVNLNGFETGLAALLLLTCTAVYLQLWPAGPSGARGFWIDVALGVLFGLSVLTRIDHGFLALSAALCYLRLAPEPLKRKCSRVFTWTLVAGIITAPWWIFCYRVGGSIMPTSGKASAFQMTFHGYWQSVGKCAWRTLESILAIPTLSFPVPSGEGLLWVFFLLGFVAALTWYFCRTKPFVALGIAPFDLRPLAFLALFGSLLMVYYIFFHGSWWFMKRYTHPIRTSAYIFSAFYVGWLAFFFEKRRWLKPLWVFSGILAGHLLIAIALTVKTYNNTDSNQFVEVASYLETHCQDGKIGAFQSGTLGYFLDNVVNLDGKNNTDALKAVTTGKVIDYMLSQNLKYIADWPSLIALYCNYDEFLRHFEPVASIGAHEIYRLRSNLPEQGTNGVYSSGPLPKRE